MNAVQRTARRNPGGRVVGPRDLLGLRLIAQARVVSTTQYMAYLEVPRSIAWRSLARLRDHGLVRVHVDRLDDDNRYALSREGSVALARACGGSPEDFPVVRGTGDLGPHHARAVDLGVAIQVALAKSKRLSLVRFLFEADLRNGLGDTRGALVPDLGFVVETKGGERTAYAAEIDLSQESAPYVRKHKLAPYRDLALLGAPLLGVSDWRVLILVPSARRLDMLAEAAWEVGVPESRFYFALHADVASATVLTAAPWLTPRAVVAAPEGALIAESPFDGARTGCSVRASRVSVDVSAIEADSSSAPSQRFRSERTA